MKYAKLLQNQSQPYISDRADVGTCRKRVVWLNSNHLEKLFPPVFSRNDQRPHPVAEAPQTNQADSAHEGPQAAHGGEKDGVGYAG